MLVRLFFLLQCVILMPLLRVLLGVRVRGPRLKKRPDQGVIVAANHQSWIDPGMIQYAILPHQVTYLMTELFYDLPVVGLYFRASKTHVVREEGPSVSGIRAAQKALLAGEIICLFPEGEITTTGEMGRGRRGVARLARRTGALVLPLGIRGAIHVYSKVQPRPRRATVELRLGTPMSFDETADRAGEDRFTERLMESIRGLAYD